MGTYVCKIIVINKMFYYFSSLLITILCECGAFASTPHY
jgi:hypothetical protein